MVEKKENLNAIETSIKERFTEEQIAAWKKDFGKIKRLQIGDKVIFVKPATSEHVANYTVGCATGGLNAGARYLLNELFIAGDNEIFDDEEYFKTAMLQCENLIDLKKSIITDL